jgi:hypothetical protein
MKVSQILFAIFFGNVESLRLNSNSKAENNQIAMVVKQLHEIVLNTKADGTKDTGLLQTNKEECADILATAKGDITAKQDALRNAEARESQAQAAISQYQSGIEAAAADAGTTQQTIDRAKEERAAEKATFKEEHQVAQEAITEMQNAIKIVKHAMASTTGLLSTSATTSLNKVINSLSLVSKSMGIEFEDHAQLKALIQNDDDDDDLVLTQTEAPQATEKAYVSKSGSILKVLQKLLEETEANLRKLITNDQQKSANYQLLLQSEQNELATLQADQDRQRASLEEARSKLGAASKNAAKATASLNKLRPFNEKMTRDCNRLEPDFNKRETERTAMLQALDTAITVLSGDKMRQSMGGAADAYVSLIQRSKIDDKARARVRDVLENAARRLHSVGLEQVASRVSSGGAFDGVQGMIEKMINRLESQASEEATKEDKCRNDIKTATAQQKKKTIAEKKHKSRVDMATAQIEESTDTIKDAHKQLGVQRKQLGEAEATFHEEQQVFSKFDLDSQNSLQGLDKAISALQNQFGEESFLQADDVTIRSLGAFESGSGGATGAADRASSPIGILTTIKEEMQEELVQRTGDFKNMKRLHQDSKSELQVQIEGAKTTIDSTQKMMSSLKKSLTDYNEDLDNSVQELAAITKELNTYKKACTASVQSYAERKAAREQEIASLKEALTILENETA